MAVIFAFLWYVDIPIQHVNSILTLFTFNMVVAVVVIVTVLAVIVEVVLVVVVVLYLVVVSILVLLNNITNVAGPKRSVSTIYNKFNPTSLHASTIGGGNSSRSNSNYCCL